MCHSYRILIFCPTWELLYDKCLKIYEKLRDLDISNVEILHSVYLEYLKFLNIQDLTIRLPQIVIIIDSTVFRFLRDDIDTNDVDTIVNKILSLVKC